MMLLWASSIVRKDTRSTMHFESVGHFTEANHVMSLPAAVYSQGAVLNDCSIF